ncbi:hypothetical protein MED222_06235 [Vibrio sp. MED222]|nr:hypothetical protein MED222_06235 [Vibrio sp. MED222]
MDNGQTKCGRFTCTRLSTSQYIFAF